MTSQALTEPDILARLSSHVPRWSYGDGVIRRTWRTQGWKATMMAVNAVGHLAELAYHHPEIVANFASIEVRLNTHDVGGVSNQDFALAERIDALLDWRPAWRTARWTGRPRATRRQPISAISLPRQTLARPPVPRRSRGCPSCARPSS